MPADRGMAGSAAGGGSWIPTREAALERLAEFLPRAGAAYEEHRGVDPGPGERRGVSGLSPWIRRRLITEEEVIAAVLAVHRFSDARKFVDEVCWRTYWKGWLELRPEVHRRFVADCRRLDELLASDAALEARVSRAVAGDTGIDCFDAWAGELVDTGYLHNHARMWFASIWIFTLALPWQLGARFFARHLLDGDPASNTLSWRWVAGLHTRGKHYVARAANIREYTLGRFDPVGRLDEHARPLDEADPLPAPRAAPPGDVVRTPRVALLLHDEDLHPESWGLRAEVAGVATLAGRRADGLADRFAAGALADGGRRASSVFGVSVEDVPPDDLAAWARGLGATEVVTAYAAVGPAAEMLDVAGNRLEAAGLRLVRLVRPWDSRAWPWATGGFFRFRERIPELVTHLLDGRPGPADGRL